MDILLSLGAVAGLALAGVTFALNSSTPVQLGPVPFFGGAGLFLLCLVALVVRHLVWR